MKLAHYAGANFFHLLKGQNTLLHLAVMTNRQEVARWLIDEINMNPLLKNGKGETVLELSKLHEEMYNFI